MSYVSVAIDGPSGAGKSTLARMAAQELGYLYVDTGAIYRTLALFVLQEGADPSDAQAVEALLPRAEIGMRYGPEGRQAMYLCKQDVTEEIRRPEVSMAASQVSAIPAVRAYLLEMQRSLARTHNVIMDGRDIGTVVLPDATIKIYLTASPEARAARRHRELAERGVAVPYEKVLCDIKARDQNDTTRAAAPLRRAEDALAVDTTDLSLEESFRTLLGVIKGGLNR